MQDTGSNCTKSKRQCEGYNQRVVFKDPMSAYRPTMASNTHNLYPLPPLGQPSMRRESYQQSSSGQGPLPIAPKPSGNSASTMKVGQTSSSSALPPTSSQGNERRASTHNVLQGQAKSSAKLQPRVKVQLQEKPLDTRGHSHRSGAPASRTLFHNRHSGIRRSA